MAAATLGVSFAWESGNTESAFGTVSSNCSAAAAIFCCCTSPSISMAVELVPEPDSPNAESMAETSESLKPMDFNELSETIDGLTAAGDTPAGVPEP